METVGVYIAKTHLAELLDRVSRGERITITRHGIPVATMSPADGPAKVPVAETIESLKCFGREHRQSGGSIREMIEEGRR